MPLAGLFCLLPLLAILLGPAPWALADNAAPVVPSRLVCALPHDPDAFTQGLVWDRGLLYESVGGFGVSDVRVVEPDTGQVLRCSALPKDRFGEGLALAQGRLVQLTWRAGEARLYDPGSLAPLGMFHYQGEGWGLAVDDSGDLVMSDGGPELTWRDHRDFSVLRRLVVTDGKEPVGLLNELEWVDGLVLANVLGSDRIAAVDPAGGLVRFWIDCSGLMPQSERRSPQNVLNGLAWDPDGRRLFVTGKRWPRLFQIEFDPPGQAP